MQINITQIKWIKTDYSLDDKKITVNMKLSSRRLFLMSSSQGMLYFQYSCQGKRKILLATARDDKNGHGK